ncbi:hypothetical protein QBC40DRAFT_282063 [Triangularia verruculosa]|uniref:Secreted protein n=1 Tax=Triangularia verruculosa TaxID=2587418 RepID=A0AAN6XEV3_9PEZI|nr:hypothetical protein QBC40DRAFT_282063 [Triangularia verruculosa]
MSCHVMLVWQMSAVFLLTHQVVISELSLAMAICGRPHTCPLCGVHTHTHTYTQHVSYACSRSQLTRFLFSSLC